MDLEATLRQISERLESFRNDQEEHNRNVKSSMKELKEEVATIKRGVYGDPDNLVEGLMSRQVKDEKRLKILEGVKNKALWWGAGFLVGVEAIVQLLKHL